MMLAIANAWVISTIMNSRTTNCLKTIKSKPAISLLLRMANTPPSAIPLMFPDISDQEVHESHLASAFGKGI